MKFVCSFLIFNCFVDYEEFLKIGKCEELCQEKDGKIITWDNFRRYEEFLFELLAVSKVLLGVGH